MFPSLKTLQQRNGDRLFSQLAVSVVFILLFFGDSSVQWSDVVMFLPHHIWSISNQSTLPPVEVNDADIAYDNMYHNVLLMKSFMKD